MKVHTMKIIKTHEGFINFFKNKKKISDEDLKKEIIYSLIDMSDAGMIVNFYGDTKIATIVNDGNLKIPKSIVEDSLLCAIPYLNDQYGLKLTKIIIVPSKIKTTQLKGDPDGPTETAYVRGDPFTSKDAISAINQFGRIEILNRMELYFN